MRTSPVATPACAAAARVRSRSRPQIQVIAVCGLRWNAAMCCDAHQPAPQTATPRCRSRVVIQGRRLLSQLGCSRRDGMSLHLCQDVLEEAPVGLRICHRLFGGCADLAALDHDRSIESGGVEGAEDTRKVYLSRAEL